MLYPIELQARNKKQAEKGIWTLNLSLGKALLYHLSYFRTKERENSHVKERTPAAVNQKNAQKDDRRLGHHIGGI